MNPQEPSPSLPANFWQTVKQELETDKDHELYLCSRSETFSLAWQNKIARSLISRKAEEYLRATKSTKYYTGKIFLFLRDCQATTDTEAKQFRTDFVTWCQEQDL